MEKHESLLYNVCKGDEEELPSTFTPLSLHIKNEKCARDSYLVEREDSKCSHCKVNWAMHHSIITNSQPGKKLCWTCSKKVFVPAPPPTPEPTPIKNIWGYVREKYPEWVLANARGKWDLWPESPWLDLLLVPKLTPTFLCITWKWRHQWSMMAIFLAIRGKRRRHSLMIWARCSNRQKAK